MFEENVPIHALYALCDGYEDDVDQIEHAREADGRHSFVVVFSSPNALSGVTRSLGEHTVHFVTRGVQSSSL